MTTASQGRPIDTRLTLPPAIARGERADMNLEGLIHAQSRFPISFTLVVAILLLLLGVAAAASVTFQVGPFD